MSIVTKAKITLKDGTIELEGSESFVTKELEAFQNLIKEIGKTTGNGSDSSDKPNDNEQGKSVVDKPQPKKKIMKSLQTIIPIPLNLKGDKDRSSLRDFYKEKKPRSLTESLVVFSYYLKENLKINKMEAGHVVSCCKEVGEKVPISISQMFYDIYRDHGWFNVTEKRRFAELNTAGENFVVHDLPRKENASKDKTAT